MPSLGFARPALGAAPHVTDAELVCLAVAQAHLGYGSERRWLRAAPKLVGHLFPRLLSQPKYNRRLRALSALMLQAMRYLAEHTATSFDVVRLMDSTKIICGMSRETVKRSNLFGYCGYGYDASHSLYFWGMRLLLLVTADGLVTGFALFSPKQHGEVEAARMMFAVPANRPAPGTTVVADKGFRSRPFATELRDLGLTLVREPYENEADPGVYPQWLRQRVESVIESLKGQLGIEHPGAHQPDGLFTRVIQRLLALNTAIWHNWRIGAAHKRSLIAYDH
ncbi:IS982 family transposase [Actinospica sp. MGRD01-02]|uniref:IS982 family transposase n=1 Tax=Actinospica acidithermotolerans TaxID=2828514 RepID=A0A941ILE3_9ACTN|nr:IS982 family transposase [Actinospica acidithermotolerans]MBR7828973.1 IS982 family transposase [Actinospica acidithermotolerans]